MFPPGCREGERVGGCQYRQSRNILRTVCMYCTMYCTAPVQSRVHPGGLYGNTAGSGKAGRGMRVSTAARRRATDDVGAR